MAEKVDAENLYEAFQNILMHKNVTVWQVELFLCLFMEIRKSPCLDNELQGANPCPWYYGGGIGRRRTAGEWLTSRNSLLRQGCMEKNHSHVGCKSLPVYIADPPKVWEQSLISLRRYMSCTKGTGVSGQALNWMLPCLWACKGFDRFIECQDSSKVATYAKIKFKRKFC